MTLKILAFSDWRRQNIEHLIDYLKLLEEKPDAIVYVGDDIIRFNPIPYVDLPKDLRKKFREKFIEKKKSFRIFDKEKIEEIIILSESKKREKENKFEKIASFSKHGLFVVAGNDDPLFTKKAINGKKVYSHLLIGTKGNVSKLFCQELL